MRLLTILDPKRSSFDAGIGGGFSHSVTQVVFMCLNTKNIWQRKNTCSSGATS